MHTSKIKNITYIGNRPVRDIEVDSPNHRFYANGIVVSNSHAVSYSMYSAVDLWLKHHYPLEFLCANLQVTDRVSERLDQRIRYCRGRGFKVSPPRVDVAGFEWTICGDTLVAPLSGMKGFGRNETEKIISNRPYNDVTDFLQKTGFSESKFHVLLFGGALDMFNSDREWLYNWHKEVYLKSKKKRKPKKVQMDLFFEDEETFEINKTFSKNDLNMLFKDINGFSLEDELNKKYEELFESDKTLVTVTDLAKGKCKNGGFNILGKVVSIDERTSKKGNSYYTLVLSDGIYEASVVAWKDDGKRLKEHFHAGDVIQIRLKKNSDGISVDDVSKYPVKLIDRGE